MAPQQNRSGRGRRSERVRPTTGRVRGAMFSMLGPGGLEGRRVLDLYAGTGALGLEAIRRGAAFAEFVELDRRRCAAIRAEAERLGVAGRCRVHQAQVMRAWGRLEAGYDIVFIDPPYAANPFEEIMGLLGESEAMMNEDATIFAEHDRRTELAGRYGRLIRSGTRNYGDTAVSVFRVAARTVGEKNG